MSFGASAGSKGWMMSGMLGVAALVGASVAGIASVVRARAAAAAAAADFMKGEERVYVVTGGNRGIGKAIATQLAGFSDKWVVVVTARSEKAAQEAVAEIGESAGAVGRVHGVVADVTDADGPGKVVEYLNQTLEGRCDGLVNNAGVFLEAVGSTLDDVTVETMRATYEVNVFGVLAMTKALLPLMVANGFGRIVTVGSRAGQITDMTAGGGWFMAYRSSKAAVNKVVRNFAFHIANDPEYAGVDITCNVCCPGFIATDMTQRFSDAGLRTPEKTPEIGAITPVWLATMGPGGPNGEFFGEKAPAAW